MERMDIETIRIAVEGKHLDFTLARRLGEALVSGMLTEPLLIAWFDGKKGEEHPAVPECQHKPGWLAYAEGHGGRIRVDVNDNEYSFIYADAAAAGD